MLAVERVEVVGNKLRVTSVAAMGQAACGEPLRVVEVYDIPRPRWEIAALAVGVAGVLVVVLLFVLVLLALAVGGGRGRDGGGEPGGVSDERSPQSLDSGASHGHELP